MRDWQMDRRVPIALVLTLCLQAGAAVWWASGKEKQDIFQDLRLLAVEQAVNKASDMQGQITERLARIEERMAAQVEILKRIERQTNTSR
jgi:hypothetical protein